MLPVIVRDLPLRQGVVRGAAYMLDYKARRSRWRGLSPGLVRRTGKGIRSPNARDHQQRRARAGDDAARRGVIP